MYSVLKLHALARDLFVLLLSSGLAKVPQNFPDKLGRLLIHQRL